MSEVRPSEQMRNLGIVQRGAPVLTEAVRTLDLPAGQEAAEQAVDALFASIERIAQVHPFAKGMGIAAPQIGIGRAAAVVQPAEQGAGAIVLVNPRVTESSDDTDEQAASTSSTSAAWSPVPCALPSRPPGSIGATLTTVYERGLARLVAHEIDHLNGMLYLSRMQPGVELIPVEQYRQTGRAWAYDP
ncbi:peptide deformylase [Streptomyces sp. NPDC001292]|uniref:peptide deformylase n=1 Tax=Streptomyces sp. NPDC001292 TaxID=3364558 RepID=UPI0036B79B35